MQELAGTEANEEIGLMSTVELFALGPVIGECALFQQARPPASEMSYSAMMESREEAPASAQNYLRLIEAPTCGSADAQPETPSDREVAASTPPQAIRAHSASVLGGRQTGDGQT